MRAGVFFMYAVYLHVIGLRDLSLVSKGAILVFLECMLVRYLKYAWSICSIDLLSLLDKNQYSFRKKIETKQNFVLILGNLL